MRDPLKHVDSLKVQMVTQVVLVPKLPSVVHPNRLTIIVWKEDIHLNMLRIIHRII